MKIEFKSRSCFVLLLSAVCLGTVSCGPESSKRSRPDVSSPVAIDSIALALAPHSGDERVDEEIRRLQEQVRQGRDPELALERLGWAFVAKARESFDAGFYKLAEQCALALETKRPGGAEALLLRGHV